MNNTMQRRALLIAAALVLASLATGCSAEARAKPPQAESEYASERPSAQGGFRVSYRTDAPIPVGRMHAWTLHVARADGRWQIVNVLWELKPQP